MPCYVNQYNCYYCVELYCVHVALIIPHKTRLFEVRRLRGLVAELCGPSDRHLVTLPMWQATWGLRPTDKMSLLAYLPPSHRYE